MKNNFGHRFVIVGIVVTHKKWHQIWPIIVTKYVATLATDLVLITRCVTNNCDKKIHFSTTSTFQRVLYTSKQPFLCGHSTVWIWITPSRLLLLWPLATQSIDPHFLYIVKQEVSSELRQLNLGQFIALSVCSALANRKIFTTFFAARWPAP